MDPSAAAGELLVIRPLDVRLFDVIGYDLTAVEAEAVPEPATLGLMALVGLAFVARRRRGRRSP